MKLFVFILSLLLSSAAYSQQDKNSDFAAYAKQFQKQQQNKANTQTDLPRKNISKHVNGIPSPDKTAIVKLSTACLSKAKANLTQIQLHDLDEIKNECRNDSTIVNEAMILYSAGIKTDAVIYLIAYIVSTSPDPWFINNLGVVLKDEEDYEKSLQCFLYADKNLKAPSAIVKTNLGWSSAYYGDFDAAKKYFNEALKLAPLHDGALEGLCKLAYVEGDFKALMDNLYKRIKISGFGGGGGNINQFIAPGFVDDILDAYENNTELKKSDPFENHLFDNDDQEDNTYNPGGATDIIPTLPTITAYFSYDAFGMNENMDAISQLKKEILKDADRDAERLKSKFSSLPPWKKQPYTDEHGDWIFPYNYETEYKMFERITIEFNKRDIWLAKSMIREEMDFNKTIQAGGQLVKMLNACGGKEDCICEWAKPNLGVVNSDLSGYFQFWSNLFKRWMQNVDWYIVATSACIKKVHQPQLNAYLNDKREAVVRNYILSKYSAWLDDCLRVGGEIDMLHITKECANNPPKTSIAAGDDVITPQLKKLKRWPEPCVVPTGDYDYEQLPAGIVMTCDELKLRFGFKKKITDAIKGSAALKINFKFGENEKQDEVKIYLEGAIKAGVGKDLPVGADAGIKGTAFIQFKDGKTNYGIESPEFSGSASIKNDDLTKAMQGKFMGADAKVTGSVLWTAETGAKMKLNGNKMDLPTNPFQ